MKKRSLVVLLAAVLLLGGALTASAQLRLDVDVAFPVYGGLSLETMTPTGGWLQNIFPFPNAGLYYQFGQGGLRGGVGARAFTLILESVLYPAAYVELEIKPIVLNMNVGGGAYVLFGLLNQADWARFILPDLSVGFKLNDRVRLGGGVFIIAPFLDTFQESFSNFLYFGYINLKISALFDK
jgi:hypothetical protein